MEDPVRRLLAPVRRRQQWQSMLRLAALGLFAGSLAALGLGLARWGWGARPLLPVAALALLLAGPLAGAALGFWRRPGWRAAATSVDLRYRLQDRALTALDFAARPAPSLFHSLQVREALRHLAGVKPREVVPRLLPRSLPYAVAVLAAAVAVLAWRFPAPPAAAAPPEPPEAVLAEARAIEKHIEEIEALARAEQSPELQELARQMRQKVEEMKQPGVDLPEALAKLSEMQAALAAQRAEYNVPLVESQLQSLGAAMSDARPLEGAGKALEQSQFDKAAKELEALKQPRFEPAEARAAEARMQAAAKEMQAKGLKRLGQATSRMAQGVKGDRGQLRQGARDLAKEVRDHERRKRINQLLAREEQRLKDCKSRCEKAVRNLLARQPPKGGSGAGSQPGGKGSGAPRTRTPSGGKREEVKGTPGEGPSEFETEPGREGKQKARRLERDVYQKFRRLSEAALESEAIPLGHRETIRRYFELIRPQSGEGDKAGAPR
jgi:hypothetical protein